MQLDVSEVEFDEEGDAAVAKVHDDLVARFERWLADRPRSEEEGGGDPEWVAADARTALEWKRNYADGHLGFWTISDAYELLLEWLPRKFVADADGGEAFAQAVAWFVDFLDEEGLLSDGSATPDEWARFVGENREAIRAAMEDRANFGMAKSFFTSEAPPEPQYADGSATDLLVHTDRSNFYRFTIEYEAWLARRSPEQAATELADAAAELDDPALQRGALDLIATLDRDVAGPEVRRVVAMGGSTTARRAAAYARAWLVDEELEDPATLYDPDDLDGFVDILTARLLSGGDVVLLETFALVGDHAAQIQILDRLWRSESDATLALLGALGQAHPDKKVAKAARTAAHKRETTQSSRR